MEQQTILSTLLPGTSFYLYLGGRKRGEERERAHRYEGVVERREDYEVTIKTSRDGNELTMKLPPNTVVYLDIGVGGSNWAPSSSKQGRQYLGYFEG